MSDSILDRDSYWGDVFMFYESECWNINLKYATTAFIRVSSIYLFIIIQSFGGTLQVSDRAIKWIKNNILFFVYLKDLFELLKVYSTEWQDYLWMMSRKECGNMWYKKVKAIPVTGRGGP
jgi:hypothetical protein